MARCPFPWSLAVANSLPNFSHYVVVRTENVNVHSADLGVLEAT
jgi:hypothetical protein